MSLHISWAWLPNCYRSRIHSWLAQNLDTDAYCKSFSAQSLHPHSTRKSASPISLICEGIIDRPKMVRYGTALNLLILFGVGIIFETSTETTMTYCLRFVSFSQDFMTSVFFEANSSYPMEDTAIVFSIKVREWNVLHFRHKKSEIFLPSWFFAEKFRKPENLHPQYFG